MTLLSQFDVVPDVYICLYLILFLVNYTVVVFLSDTPDSPPAHLQSAVTELLKNVC